LNIQERPTLIEPAAHSALPHNIEAEQCLLGAILINTQAYATASPYVEADDFFEPINRQIFEVCASLIATGKLATPITLKAFLPADRDIAGMTLSQYLARLVAEATTIINAPDYAKVVHDLANRRHMIGVAEDCIAVLKAAPVDIEPEAIGADTIERLDEIITGHVPQTLRSITIGDAGHDALTMQGDNASAGMTWGIADLDRHTRGIHRGELAILAGRPGMCKTGLAVHIALSAAQADHRVLYWSGEMLGWALAQRAQTELVFKTSGRRIPYSDLRGRRTTITDADLRDADLVRDAQDELTRLAQLFVIEQ